MKKNKDDLNTKNTDANWRRVAHKKLDDVLDILEELYPDSRVDVDKGLYLPKGRLKFPYVSASSERVFHEFTEFMIYMVRSREDLFRSYNIDKKDITIEEIREVLSTISLYSSAIFPSIFSEMVDNDIEPLNVALKALNKGYVSALFKPTKVKRGRTARAKSLHALFAVGWYEHLLWKGLTEKAALAKLRPHYGHLTQNFIDGPTRFRDVCKDAYGEELVAKYCENARTKEYPGNLWDTVHELNLDVWGARGLPSSFEAAGKKYLAAKKDKWL